MRKVTGKLFTYRNRFQFPQFLFRTDFGDTGPEGVSATTASQTFPGIAIFKLVRGESNYIGGMVIPNHVPRNKLQITDQLPAQRQITMAGDRGLDWDKKEMNRMCRTKLYTVVFLRTSIRLEDHRPVHFPFMLLAGCTDCAHVPGWMPLCAF